MKITCVYINGDYTIPKTLENLECGDIITDGTYFRRILARLGGEGELTTYAVSGKSRMTESISLKEADNYSNRTAYELGKAGYTPKPKKTEREKLVEEYVEEYETRIIQWVSGPQGETLKFVLREFSDKLLK